MTWIRERESSAGLQAAPLHNQAKTEGRTFFACLCVFLVDGQTLVLGVGMGGFKPVNFNCDIFTVLS
jgi:hypothetical protein